MEWRINFTEYVGDDILVTAGKDNSYPAIGFISNRSENQKDGFYLGNAGFSIDEAPPLIQKVYEPKEESGSFILRIKAFDNEQISSVEALNKFDSLPLFDDGHHYDSLANDNIYGNITTESYNYYGDEIGFIDINHLSLPINNKGVLGDVMPYLKY
ncbi:MAG: hypothetical protein U5K00_24590 [Melioribacteraceae bacterium]|nr:hypothetical protein [Melioribacteraceae bacterium]